MHGALSAIPSNRYPGEYTLVHVQREQENAMDTKRWFWARVKGAVEVLFPINSTVLVLLHMYLAACCLPETILGMQSGCTEDLLIGPGRGPAGRVVVCAGAGLAWLSARSIDRSPLIACCAKDRDRRGIS